MSEFARPEYSFAYPCETHTDGETTQIVGVWDLARYRTSRFSANSDSRPGRPAFADVTKGIDANFIQRLYARLLKSARIYRRVCGKNKKKFMQFQIFARLDYLSSCGSTVVCTMLIGRPLRQRHSKTT
jgi:hypothetical protein